ncbi:UNVERIFIED_CONTAM: hypothetical protein HDU68_011739, partial [Siphonaria sp. JEL0065]
MPTSNKTFPTEILDEIVCHLDATTLFNLCHALPRLKYISEVIFEIGSKFNMPLDTLWPEMWFPVKLNKVPSLGTGLLPAEPIMFGQEDSQALGVLVKLITRHRGSVTVPIHTSEYANLVLPLLPKTIKLHLCVLEAWTFGDFDGLTEEYLSFLTILFNSGISFSRIDVPHFAYEDLHILEDPDFLKCVQGVRSMRFFGQDQVPVNAFLEFKSLEWLQTDFCSDNIFSFPNFLDVLRKHPTLTRVDFENLNQFGEDEDIALARVFGVKEMDKIGWECVDDVGEIYGNPCVSWLKKN